MEKVYYSKPSITCGVPQDSILGSLLFLLYINDMLRLWIVSCLVFQHKDVKMIEESLNRDFSTLIDWFVGNKLSLNFSKT